MAMATPGIVLVAARVVGHDADGCRSQHALLPAETDPEIRFAMRKVFLLGQMWACCVATPGVMVIATWVVGHDADGCRCQCSSCLQRLV